MQIDRAQLEPSGQEASVQWRRRVECPDVVDSEVVPGRPGREFEVVFAAVVKRNAEDTSRRIKSRENKLFEQEGPRGAFLLPFLILPRFILVEIRGDGFGMGWRTCIRIGFRCGLGRRQAAENEKDEEERSTVGECLLDGMRLCCRELDQDTPFPVRRPKGSVSQRIEQRPQSLRNPRGRCHSGHKGRPNC